MTTRRPLGLAARLTEYGDRDFAAFLRRSFARAMGLSDEALGKPIVGIVNTFSELNNCHANVLQLIEAVKRGVWQVGALPREFPVPSLGEVYLEPSAMMYRNLLALTVEALLTAQPIDAAVLVGGCDKTMPGLLMGAASAGVPSVALVTGPMLTGSHEGERVAACSDCRRFWGRYRRGEIDAATLAQVERQLAPTAGTCGVMGTASTMACLIEALGLMLPGGAAIPAVHAERLRHAEEAGRAAAGLVESGRTIAALLSEASFYNALRVLQAIGGSTNAVIHLTALAGRCGLRLPLSALDEVSDTPLLVDLKPSGVGYMEDLHRAGGLAVVLRELRPLLRLEARTIDGRTLGEVLDGPNHFPAWQNVVRPRANPLRPDGSLIVLRGSLAPEGAVLKRSAASPELLRKTGRAVVFTSLADLAARLDAPDLDVTPDDVLVLQNAGPLGGPGMPEAGAFPVPKKLAGVRDMVRISDARMSGTAFGTVVLHVAPEAAAGGPLGLVRTGDRIALDAEGRRLDLLVGAEEMERRRRQWRPARPAAARGYAWLYERAVQQAHLGCDFDFLRHEALRPERGASAP
jgi:dihydroxy-acid dehydratase